MGQEVNLWLYLKGLRTYFPENNRSYIKKPLWTVYSHNGWSWHMMWPKLMECTIKVSRTWWHLWKFEHPMSGVRSHMKV